MTEQENDAPLVEVKPQFNDVFGFGKAAEKLAPAAEKLVDAIRAGVGVAYEPVFIYFGERMQGKTRRDELKADIQLAQELGLKFDPTTLDAMKTRLVLSEYRRQGNIIEATKKAVEYAERGPQPENPTDVAPDFVAEWLEGVKDVSHDELRNIWAKHLAAAPSTETGRIPKPAVDLLKLFDGDMAEDFEQMVHYAYGAEYAVPSVMMSDLASDFAEEIGIGQYEECYRLDTKLPYLSIDADDGLFYVFNLGARARAIAETLLDDEARKAGRVHFAEEFVSYLTAFSAGSTIRDGVINVTDRHRRRHFFNVSFYEGDLVRLGLVVPEQALEAVKLIEVDDTETWPLIQAALIELARDNLIVSTIVPVLRSEE